MSEGGMTPDAFLAAQAHKPLLRFLTCGSVDDGKSTLIGRLLFDSQKVLTDQAAALRANTARWGTTGEDIDLALLVDGLQAEREQGITIDVAYRCFDSAKRKFIIADTPGHEQYTRNMATGASTADAAVILIDATRGMQIQTRRHAFIVSLLGIKHVIAAVNKMDAVAHSQDAFERIGADFAQFAEQLRISDVSVVPVSALRGDNVVVPSVLMPWYSGPTLLELLEAIDASADDALQDLRFPVQLVSRPHANFRGYAGTVEAGTIRSGDAVMTLPSRRMSHVKSIVTFDGERPAARAGDAVTVTLDDEIDVGRGDVIVHADRAPSLTDRFEAHVIWMSDAPLLIGKAYEMKIGTRSVIATIEAIHARIDVNDLSTRDADELNLNDIALCRVVAAEPVVFDAYDTCRATGSFILIDRVHNGTVGAGMIRRSAANAAAAPSDDVVWEPTRVTREQRANQKGQSPCVLWFTGLSGSGKSTIANALEHALFLRGHHSYLLDGDNVRHGLNRDLDFSDAGRVENIRRIGEVTKLFADAGVIAIAAFISPFRSDRQLVRELVGADEFVEIYLSTPIGICEARDRKGLYAKARSGAVKNFTGVTSPYEAPESPEISLDTSQLSLQECVDRIVRYLEMTKRLKN